MQYIHKRGALINSVAFRYRQKRMAAESTLLADVRIWGVCKGNSACQTKRRSHLTTLSRLYWFYPLLSRYSFFSRVFFFVVFYFPAPFSSLLYSLVLLRFPNSSLTYISGAASPVSPSPSLAVIIHYHQIIPVNWSFVRISFRIIKALKAVLFWWHWKCQRIRSKFNFAVHLIFLTYFLWRTFSIYIRVRFQLDPSLTPAIHIIK